MVMTQCFFLFFFVFWNLSYSLHMPPSNKHYRGFPLDYLHVLWRMLPGQGGAPGLMLIRPHQSPSHLRFPAKSTMKLFPFATMRPDDTMPYGSMVYIICPSLRPKSACVWLEGSSWWAPGSVRVRGQYHRVGFSSLSSV